MIYKFSITYKVTNFERVPGSWIINKNDNNDNNNSNNDINKSKKKLV